MKFTPGKTVVLQSSDGTEYKATPFFYSTVSGGGLSVELYCENGKRLHAVDTERGVYSMGDSGLRLTVKSVIPNEAEST